MTKLLHFPNNFLWGTATAAYQIEGNNDNTDWWHWEKKPKKKNTKYPREQSGIACDSYNRFEEDFELAKKLNNNAIRISIEWARIEPAEGYFDQKEINHYRKVLQAAKERNLKTFVTLHHFTNPLWFSQKGGWVNPLSPTIFSRYVKKCTEEFADLVDTFLTINEPHVYIVYGFANGKWPPNLINPVLSVIVQNNFINAHIKAYNTIKQINSEIKVGIPLQMVWYEETKGPLRLLDKMLCKLLYFANTDFFMFHIKNHIDIIAMNYYFTIKLHSIWPVKAPDMFREPKSFLNYDGLEKILLKLKKYNKPIYITESGMPDEKDEYRPQQIKSILHACYRVINKGVDLKGYFHWSLIDNFEWHHGYWPRFGLVEIDREDNLKRKPRKSFYYYANICRNNALEL